MDKLFNIFLLFKVNEDENSKKIFDYSSIEGSPLLLKNLNHMEDASIKGGKRKTFGPGLMNKYSSESKLNFLNDNQHYSAFVSIEKKSMRRSHHFENDNHSHSSFDNVKNFKSYFPHNNISNMFSAGKKIKKKNFSIASFLYKE